jgi:3-methyladenine DNA glycosylase Mpg
VLVRAAEPVENLAHSATGPGNLTKAFRIEMRHNRVDLCDPKGDLWVAPRAGGDRPRIWKAPRVGVDYSGKWAEALLRFADRDSPFVSRPRPPSGRRPPRR